MKYLALLRGINVGGKNNISMQALKSCLEDAGFEDVATFLNTGNVMFAGAEQKPRDLAEKIEQLLINNFQFDSELIKVLVLPQPKLKKVIEAAPKGFGSQPEKYHSDVVFMIDIDTSEAFGQFVTNPEVDAMWQGDGVVYFQRLSSLRTKSRLSRIVGTPIYKSMTIRTWNTTRKLLNLLNA